MSSPIVRNDEVIGSVQTLEDSRAYDDLPRGQVLTDEVKAAIFHPYGEQNED